MSSAKELVSAVLRAIRSTQVPLRANERAPLEERRGRLHTGVLPGSFELPNRGAGLSHGDRVQQVPRGAEDEVARKFEEV